MLRATALPLVPVRLCVVGAFSEGGYTNLPCDCNTMSVVTQLDDTLVFWNMSYKAPGPRLSDRYPFSSWLLLLH